jgi:hypothetical protein
LGNLVSKDFEIMRGADKMKPQKEKRFFFFWIFFFLFYPYPSRDLFKQLVADPPATSLLRPPPIYVSVAEDDDVMDWFPKDDTRHTAG